MPGPDFTRQLEKWKKEAERWATESELARSRFSKSVSVTQETTLTKPWLAAAEEVSRFALNPAEPLVRTVVSKVTGKPVSEVGIQSQRIASALKTAGVRSQEEEKADFDLAVTNLAKANWYADFYSIAPAMVEQGLISSLEEYGQKMLPPTFLTSDEVAEVKKSISSMAAVRPTKPEELPEFLQVPEKKQAAITKFLTAPTVTTPITLNSMTVNEILKSMRTPAVPATPKDLGTPEEILANAKLMGYTEEQLKESSSLTEYVKVRSQQARDWEQKIADVKSGLTEWGMPETDWKQKAITAITQPATTFGQVIEPVITNISYPSTGFIVMLEQYGHGRDQELQREYEKLSAGKNVYESWLASGEAYDVWAEKNFSLLQRLVVELITDPLIFVPGKALSIPARGLVTAGTAMEKGILPVRYSGMAIKLAGNRMLWLNQGMYDVLDVPVKGFELLRAKIPLAFSQTTRKKAAEFTQDIFGTTGEHVGKLPTEVTVADISRTLDDSVAALKADPTDFNSKKVQLGSKLREFVPADKATIESWAKKVDGDAVVTRKVITDVNDIITDFKLGVGTAEQNGKRLAVALGAEDTPANAARLAKQLDSYVTKFSIDIEMAKEIGRTAKEQPRLAMMNYLAESYSKIARAAAESEFATGKRFDGIILALQQAVDAEERNSIRLALDKYAVRPMAEAGLGSLSYAPYNAIESMLIMAAEGTNPFKFFTAAEFTQSFSGLVGIDPRLFDSALRAAKGVGVGGASDVAGMIGTMPGRSQFSILPSDVLKVPETIGFIFGKPIKTPLGLGGADWIKWVSGKGGIELSDLMGTYQRMSYLIQKYHQHLRVLAADYIIDGVNVLEAIERIASNPPTLTRGASLGITPEWLTRELSNRALTSDSRIVQAMKELLTNGYLQQKELQKIIRQADWLSPQAKDTAMQMIAENKVLLDADSIIDFVKTLADQSIADLKAAPSAIPDNFKYLAGLIEQTPVANKKDLAIVLREYLVMSETASNLPSAMIERAFDETRKLRSAGKYDQVRGLWNKHHEDLAERLESINASLEQVKAKALANSNLLPPEQAASMKALLDRFSARNALHEKYFSADRALLDEYWSLPRNQREAQWNITDTSRVKLHGQFKNQDAVLGAGDFMAKKEYNDLFWNLPEEPIFPVDATSRALSSNDVARILGTNVDGVSRALAENVALQQREYFTQLVLKHAEARPDAFKGITEAKVSAVYDEILRGMNFDPGKDIGVQRILQGAEELKLKLINQQMIGSLLPNEEKALHGWIDDGAKEVRNLFRGKGAVGPPTVSRPRGKLPTTAKEQEEALAKLDDQIDSLQTKLDEMENPDTKAGEALQERISSLEDSKAEIEALDFGGAEPSGKLTYPETAGRPPSGFARPWTVEEAEETVTKLDDLIGQIQGSKEEMSRASSREYLSELIAYKDEITEALTKARSAISGPMGKIAYKELRKPPEGFTRPTTVGEADEQIAKLNDEISRIQGRGALSKDSQDYVSELIAYRDYITEASSRARPRAAGAAAEEIRSDLLPEGWKVRIAEPKTGHLLAEVEWADKSIRVSSESVARNPVAMNHEIAHILIEPYMAADKYKIFNADFIRASGEAVAELKAGNLGEIAADRLGEYLSGKPVTSDLQTFFRKYFPNSTPLTQPRVAVPAAVPSIVPGLRESWTKVRQKASDQAHRDMYRAFADYTNQNILDAQMKMLLPYWTYEFYRWTTGLPRLALKHPGIATTWGKYSDYTDKGHIQLPGLDLSVNPFTSSMLGVTFGLARKDYQSYYSNLGQVGEALEIWERYGFYPHALIRGAVAMTPIFSGRPPELGTIVPPIGNLGMELMTASKIPGVVESMEWLRDHIFHENFRNYYVATAFDGMQAEAGGDLIEGQNGTDLWHKIQRKEELTPEEKELWETASRGDVAWISALRTQFPQFRLKEDEQIVAVQQISQIFEQYAGMSEKYQQELWRNNLKPTDMMGGLPLELRPVLDQLWQWKLWMGRGQILMAPELSDLYNRIDEYWDRVKDFQKIRIEQSVPDKYLSQNDINEGWLNPTKKLHFDGGDWVRESANTWQNYTAMVDALKLDPRFKQAIFAITPEGQIELAKKLGYSAPVRNPLDEAIDLYFSIQLKKATDKYTGEEDWDFAGFWLNKESVRMALTKEQRHDFDAIVRKYETIPERLHRQVNNKYLRGYKAVPRILLKNYDEEQKALIAEYYSNTTSMTRKEEIRATTAPSGKQLISDWEKSLTDARAKLRLISPMLDFWLYVYKGTKPKTPAAVSLAQQYDANRNMVLDFIDWNPPTTEE